VAPALPRQEALRDAILCFLENWAEEVAPGMSALSENGFLHPSRVWLFNHFPQKEGPFWGYTDHFQTRPHIILLE
jgi:hypothetical protein